MNCPNCDEYLNVHIAIGYTDEPPTSGDIIFCAFCRTPLILESNGILHVMSELEKSLLTDSQRDDIDFASRLPKPDL